MTKIDYNGDYEKPESQRLNTQLPFHSVMTRRVTVGNTLEDYVGTFITDNGDMTDVYLSLNEGMDLPLTMMSGRYGLTDPQKRVIVGWSRALVGTDVLRYTRLSAAAYCRERQRILEATESRTQGDVVAKAAAFGARCLYLKPETK